jgi:hypothetical protein
VNDSACHDSHKIISKLIAVDITRAPHPPYSPGLSPCDFWLFGFLKEPMQGMGLSTEDQIVEAITTIWWRVTFDTLHSVFQEWMQWLNWIIKNNGEYYFEYLSWSKIEQELVGISRGCHDFVDPLYHMMSTKVRCLHGCSDQHSEKGLSLEIYKEGCHAWPDEHC